MASLHIITEETKSILKWAGITIIVFVFLFIFIKLGGTIKEIIFPTPPEAPTVIFGKLPAVPFPQNVTNKKFSFTINTVSGLLPVLPDRASVYPLASSSPNLLSLKRAQNKIEALGFPTDGVALSETLYKWNEGQSPFRTLTLDILSNNFILSSDFKNNETLVNSKNLPTESDAINTVQSFLSQMSLLPQDLDDAKTKTNLFTLNNGALAQVENKSAASLIQVNLFQKDVEKLPIYYPNFPNSTMEFLLTGGDEKPQILQASFTYFSLEKNSSSTYPIKTAAAAYEELKTGNAYIASYSGKTKNIQIKNISLGYYLGNEKQAYLYPVILFEGDNGFVAFVPAITQIWIDK